jgi:site-specific DNA-methyltransferase (adenine-specific)
MAKSASTQDRFGAPSPPQQQNNYQDIDLKSVHGNPQEIALAPGSDSSIMRLANSIEAIPSVTQAAVERSEHNIGPIELVFSVEDEDPSIADLSRIAQRVDTKPQEHARFIQHPTGIQHVLPADEIDGAVQVYEHPIYHHTDYSLAKAQIRPQTTVKWDTSNEELTTTPTTTEWESVAPLRIEFTEVKASDLTSFKKTLKDAVSPSRPPQYLTTISESVVEATEPDPDSDIGVVKTGVLEIAYRKIHKEALPENDDAVIIQGNAESLSEPATTPNTPTTPDLPDTPHIQLTVTSPPYLDAINYEDYEISENNDYTGNTGDSITGVDGTSTIDETIAAWRAQQARIFKGVYEATREGGFCAVIIGKTRSQGELVDLPAEFATMMRKELDWNLHEKITWHKITGGNSKFGTTAQHNHPTYYHANQLTAEIYVFRKGDTAPRKEESVEINLNEFVQGEVANNFWNIPPEPHNKEGVNHPCPYPTEIPHRLISLYSYPGDTVLDPMAGSGSTLKVARNLNRKAIGVELEPKFVHEARRRTFTEPYERNSQKILNLVDIPAEQAQITTQAEKGNLQGSLTDFL